jgi:ABC-type phosphate transport system auxiliary subunit
MSEERFDRLENQLSQVIQAVSAMQKRIDSIEGTLLVAMRSGFESLQTSIDEIDHDLNIAEVQSERNARLNRKLNQRVTVIEARLDDLP